MSQLLPSASMKQSQPDTTAIGLEAHEVALSAFTLGPEAVDAAAQKAEVSALHATTKSLLDGMGISLASSDQGRNIHIFVH